VSSGLLREGRHPLLLVGPSCDTDPARPFRIERLLVCLDGSAVATAILPLVRALASELGAFVLLNHVMYPPVDPVTRDAVLTREQTAMFELLAHQARRWADLAVDWRVDEGTHAAATIADQAERRAMDVIAMATHGRSALEQMLVGSTTSEVLGRARVPVLTLRPSTRLHCVSDGRDTA
jgi:nucleotide-binding universal stress UspA family protein